LTLAEDPEMLLFSVEIDTKECIIDKKNKYLKFKNKNDNEFPLVIMYSCILELYIPDIYFNISVIKNTEYQIKKFLNIIHMNTYCSSIRSTPIKERKILPFPTNRTKI
jgi:hypothetical protein